MTDAGKGKSGKEKKINNIQRIKLREKYKNMDQLANDSKYLKILTIFKANMLNLAAELFGKQRTMDWVLTLFLSLIR